MKLLMINSYIIERLIHSLPPSLNLKYSVWPIFITKHISSHLPIKNYDFTCIYNELHQCKYDDRDDTIILLYLIFLLFKLKTPANRGMKNYKATLMNLIHGNL